MHQLSRAFELAYFLHREEDVAFQVALAARSRFEVAAARQEKRLYYRPKRRRNRVLLRPETLLQRLVLQESEAFERRREREPGGGLTGEDRLAWFVAYLARLVFKRSSFHAAVAVCRLLHRYSTRETLTLYDLIAQDADCRFQEDACRAAKKLLMDELSSRFGSALAFERGPRGEKRLTSRRPSDAEAELVLRTLDVVKPWGTSCRIPEDFDPRDDPLPALRSPGGDPDGAHGVELDRIHALLHAACFERATRALGLAPPRELLRIPAFAAGSPRPTSPVRPRSDWKTVLLRQVSVGCAQDTCRAAAFSRFGRRPGGRAGSPGGRVDRGWRQRHRSEPLQ